jgi:hypothetical protein
MMFVDIGIGSLGRRKYLNCELRIRHPFGFGVPAPVFALQNAPVNYACQLQAGYPLVGTAAEKPRQWSVSAYWVIRIA